ncbi:hypothetical protein D3C81_2339060 [compost metagenome]
MVALDDERKPVPVPPLQPRTRDEKRRYLQGQHRRQLRQELEQRYQAIREEDLGGDIS